MENSPSQLTEKWQRLLLLLAEYPLQPNPTRQLKKLAFSRLLTENFLALLFQYTGLMITTLIPLPSPLWFATGTACAFTFLRGLTILPGIWLGTATACYFANCALSFTFIAATLLSLQALASLLISYRFITPTLIFYRRKMVAKFLIYNGLLTAAITLALASLCYSAFPATLNPLALWLQWWLANLGGILVIGSALVSWDNYFPQLSQMKECHRLQLGAQIMSILLLSLGLLLSPYFVICGMCLFCLTLIMSSCYGWCGAIGSVCMVGVICSLGAYMQAPFFALTNGGIYLSLLLIGCWVVNVMKVVA